MSKADLDRKAKKQALKDNQDKEMSRRVEIKRRQLQAADKFDPRVRLAEVLKREKELQQAK